MTKSLQGMHIYVLILYHDLREDNIILLETLRDYAFADGLASKFYVLNFMDHQNSMSYTHKQ